jgi:peptide/nickel transport system substrate-binding protein
MSKPKIDAESTLGTQKICSAKTLKYKKGKTSNVEKNNSNPIGTGPYKLKLLFCKWVVSDKLLQTVL